MVSKKNDAGVMGAYRIIDMPVIASPCRTCGKLCYSSHSRNRCLSMRKFRKVLKSEFSGYGVAENNY